MKIVMIITIFCVFLSGVVGPFAYADEVDLLCSEKDQIVTEPSIIGEGACPDCEALVQSENKDLIEIPRLIADVNTMTTKYERSMALKDLSEFKPPLSAEYYESVIKQHRDDLLFSQQCLSFMQLQPVPKPAERIFFSDDNSYLIEYLKENCQKEKCPLDEKEYEEIRKFRKLNRIFHGPRSPSLYSAICKSSYIIYYNREEHKMPPVDSINQKAYEFFKNIRIPTEQNYIKKLEEGLAQINSNNYGCGIKLNEITSLRYYTTRGYDCLNGVMRGKDISRCEHPKTVATTFKLINSALAKILPFEGTVYRFAKLPEKVLKAHQKGAVIQFTGYLSASFEITKYWTDRPHKYVIQSKSGRKIDALSKNMNEKEVLFPIMSQFLITDVIEEDGKTVFYMDELPSFMY